MTGVTVEPTAIAHLEEIYDYTVNRWSFAQAEGYLLGLYEMFERIGARRINWQTVAVAYGVDGYFCRYRNHVIYWRDRSDGNAGIVAVLHERVDQAGRVSRAFNDEP